MKCKFCGDEGNLIEAHVIPAGAFPRIKQQDKKALEIITSRASEYAKKAPLGVYDKTIVCNRCENIWQLWAKGDTIQATQRFIELNQGFSIELGRKGGEL